MSTSVDARRRTADSRTWRSRLLACHRAFGAAAAFAWTSGLSSVPRLFRRRGFAAASSSNLRCAAFVARCSRQRESIPRGSYGAVKPLLEHLARRQLREILGNVNATRVEIEVLDGLALLSRAKNDAKRGSFRRLTLVAIKPAEVQLDLSRVCGLEIAELELDGDEPTHPAVEEQEVDVVVVAVDNNSLLALDKGEAGAKLEQEALDLAEQRGLEVLLAVGVLQ